jgi:hypothetical protein
VKRSKQVTTPTTTPNIGDLGDSTPRPCHLLPTEQAWFFTPGWLAGEREADEQIASGHGRVFKSAEEMFAHLDALPGQEA